MLAACIEAYCSIKPQQFINAIMKYITKLHVHVANVDKWYIILNNVLLNNCRHFIFKTKLSRVVCFWEMSRILLSKVVTLLVAWTSFSFP